MNCYDIVYIKGNPSSGTTLQHQEINSTIVALIESYNYIIIESEHKNLSDFCIPNAKIYIGFSRGSRYLKKISSDKLKISIGGVTSSKVHRFTHENDKILQGDMSENSMQSHFTIIDSDKIKIKSLIDDFLTNEKLL